MSRPTPENGLAEAVLKNAGVIVEGKIDRVLVKGNAMFATLVGPNPNFARLHNVTVSEKTAKSLQNYKTNHLDNS